MTKEEFDIITNKIGCWFTHLKLNSFRKTFDGEVYPSSALGTDYDIFIYKLEKELSFEDNPSLPSNLDEAAEEYSRRLDYYHYTGDDPSIAFKSGAEWMAVQGETHELTVESPVLGPPMICCPVHADNGDKVVVQIRKGDIVI